MNNKKLKTIEDCLEVLTGVEPDAGPFNIAVTDQAIMVSIAKQTSKGTALTDKQHTLILEKLQGYKRQFMKNMYVDFDEAINELRKPLREVDRSKYIALVFDELPSERHISGFTFDPPYIKVRFPFKKSLMSSLYKVSKNVP